MLLGNLTKTIRPSYLLSSVIMVMAIVIVFLLIINSATGGDMHGLKDSDRIGTWSPWIIFPAYITIGICQGGIESVRRLIPK